MRGRIPYVTIVGLHIAHVHKNPCGSRDFPNQALLFNCTPISFFAASFCLFFFTLIINYSSYNYIDEQWQQQEKVRPGNEAIIVEWSHLTGCNMSCPPVQWLMLTTYLLNSTIPLLSNRQSRPLCLGFSCTTTYFVEDLQYSLNGFISEGRQ